MELTENCFRERTRLTKMNSATQIKKSRNVCFIYRSMHTQIVGSYTYNYHAEGENGPCLHQSDEGSERLKSLSGIGPGCNQMTVDMKEKKHDRCTESIQSLSHRVWFRMSGNKAKGLRCTDLGPDDVDRLINHSFPLWPSYRPTEPSSILRLQAIAEDLER